MTAGQRIRQRRIELGMTQEELATKMGYSGKTSVCAAETSGDNITTTKIQKFADALGVSQKYLMYGEESEEPPAADSKAMELYSLYESLPPDKRTAFEDYLRFLQSGS